MKKKIVLSVAAFIAVFACNAQFLSPVVDSIPMRDGKKLAADIYVPDSVITRPTILIQTPYNRIAYRLGLPLGVGLELDSCNYNFVIVDWRGFYGSAGAAGDSTTRGEDGYDCVEWIASQSWSDGKIGTWGPSALGKVQYQTAQEQPPHLVCINPLVAGSQFNYDEYFPGGVYRKEYVDQLDALGYGMSLILLANAHYNIVWQFSEPAAYYPDEIAVPVFMIGGWYDHNVKVMLSLFEGLQTSSPVAVRDKHKLLMGPWVHGGHGSAYVGSSNQGELSYPDAAGWSDSLSMRYFDFYLLDSANGWESEPVIRYFQMGDDIWEAADSWPPAGLTDHTLFLQKGGGMNLNLPPADGDSSIFFYDPKDPSPTYGGPTLRTDQVQGPYDQSDTIEGRGDIAIFTTDELTQDVVMKGSPRVHLFISSDRKDTDFAVRLTDVYPDGRSMLVLDGIRRMRFRNGYTPADTAFMEAGNIYEVEIEMVSTAITFKAGHRIRLDITSSNYPRFDNNLNNGGEMYAEGDTLTATNVIYHNSANASFLELPLESFPVEVSRNRELLGNLSIYPIPCKEQLTLVTYSEKPAEMMLEMKDIAGRNVLTQNVVLQKGSNTVQINTTPLNSGIYLIYISDDTGFYEAGKAIVMD